MSWIRGLCTKNDINQKSWAHLIEPRWLRSRFIGTWKFRISFLYHFKVKRVFTAPLRTTNTPNNSRSITYYKNNVQSPLEHTQSLHFTNIGRFFTCLNCIPPTKFASAHARVLFTIHDSFPRESSQCIINFWFSWECHAMVKISLWSTPFVLSHLLRNSSKYLRSWKILRIEQVIKD